MRPLRIMQLVYSLRIGGSEKLAFDIAAHLDQRRFRFSVCAMDLDGELGPELDSRLIPHHVLHRRGVELRIFRQLHKLIRDNRIDVVHTHHFTQLFYAALPARLAGARIIHTEHEFFSYREAKVPRMLIGPLSRFCEAITVVGPEVGDYFVRIIGLQPRRVAVVPNGVDVRGFDYDRGAARRELGLADDALVIGTIGRLEAEKNQAALLDVFRQLAADHPKARLVIAGDGSLSGTLKEQAGRAGIADRTQFLGYRRDVPKLLAAMDVFVLTSNREGLPISILEALAARRPVVAPNIGSIGTLVRNECNGLLIEPGDTAGFTTALGRLIASPELRQRMGASGRQIVESSFSLSGMLRAYEELYASAARKSHVWN